MADYYASLSPMDQTLMPLFFVGCIAIIGLGGIVLREYIDSLRLSRDIENLLKALSKIDKK